MSLRVVGRDAALGACLCENDMESEHHFTYFNASCNFKQTGKITK